ncbi:VOC family protein [Cohnella ginsengisoli]|uniref:VOC family protein n=1 Tax=Cohnella ginsengisoli TaxID=425004 RepID=A0A9X4QLK7_9BACL|nr:VOC family protein [Cohnella ginsengisoli]MDG0790550.1 VOC family protein [Cohnella ginsengisoli]
MEQAWKPPGFNSVNPYLIVREADRLIDFLTEAFDARLIERHTDETGAVRHAACRLGDSIVELSGGVNESFPPTRCALHVYVEDTDATYTKALNAGAKPLYPPQDHDYGERSGGVEDDFGNHWYIATFGKK